MATLQDMKDSLAAIATGVTALGVSIKDLKAQVAAGGGPVSQADLDALAVQAADIVADINNIQEQP